MKNFEHRKKKKKNFRNKHTSIKKKLHNFMFKQLNTDYQHGYTSCQSYIYYAQANNP